MADSAAAVLSVAVAAASVYALCRHLSCARLPAAFGAAAWALSQALLSPGAGAPAFALIGSSVLAPFALTGAFSRERRRWPFLALTLVCAALRWRSVAAAPAEIEAFVIAVLAGLGAQRLWDGEGGAAFVIGAGAAMFAAVRGFEAGTARCYVEVVPAAAALALVALMSREARARAGLVGLVALFGVQRALEIGLGAVPVRPSVETAVTATHSAR